LKYNFSTLGNLSPLQLFVLCGSVIKVPKGAVLAGVRVGAEAGVKVCLGLYLGTLIISA